jgi:hypothetical protein
MQYTDSDCQHHKQVVALWQGNLSAARGRTQPRAEMPSCFAGYILIFTPYTPYTPYMHQTIQDDPYSLLSRGRKAFQQGTAPEQHAQDLIQQQRHEASHDQNMILRQVPE